LLKKEYINRRTIESIRKAKQQKEAHGEIETEHPGYLGSQDTYYVGTIKGVGEIYQQLLLIHIVDMLLLNYTLIRQLSLQQIFLMIWFCLGSMDRELIYREY
jgi:hypothetical protein